MTKRQVLATFVRSLSFRLALGVVLLYIVYHCVSAFSDRIVTDIVTQGEDTLTYRATATVVRDERVVSVSGNRFLCSYLVPDGAKINAGAEPVQLYTVSADIGDIRQMQNTLSALDRQISIAASLSKSNHLSALPTAHKDAQKALLEAIRAMTDGASVPHISDDAFSLLLALDRIEALTGRADAQTLVISLRLRRQELLLTASPSGRTLTFSDFGSDASGGYFFYGTHVDGYETVFSRDALSDLTLEEWRVLSSTPPTVYGDGITAVGKLVEDYRWSIVLPVDTATAAALTEGDTFEICFIDEDDLTLRMTLDRLLSPSDGLDGLAIFSCNVMPESFSYTRFSRVELVLSRAQGYRIPTSALRSVGGQDGVYVLEEGRIYFRTVHIVSRGEGYVLVYAPTAKERADEQDTTYAYDRYVHVHDVIVTEGNDLYDGKLIK